MQPELTPEALSQPETRNPKPETRNAFRYIFDPRSISSIL